MCYNNEKGSETMIEFNQLEHLVAIAKNKTISKAAEEETPAPLKIAISFPP